MCLGHLSTELIGFQNNYFFRLLEKNNSYKHSIQNYFYKAQRIFLVLHVFSESFSVTIDILFVLISRCIFNRIVEAFNGFVYIERLSIVGFR